MNTVFPDDYRGLFGDYVYRMVPVTKAVNNKRFADLLLIKLREGISLTSKNEQPMVRRSKIICPPKDIICFHRILAHPICGAIPHFYSDDQMLCRVWNRWEYYQNRFTQFDAVISPDFSTFRDLPITMIQHNIFRNKLLAARWQRNGLDVIPNVTFAGRETFEYAVEGWPHNSMIALNSTGLGRDKKSRFAWRDGYEYIIGELKPAHILRYGGRQEGEDEEISTYYENDNKKFAQYGR